MFTDIVGFTSFAQTNEARALRQLEDQRILLRSIFPRHNGREIKTIGDGFLVEFSSALEAVECSIDIQKEMHEKKNNLRSSIGQKFSLRIGIHLGDIIFNEGDILGDAVNISSRIEPLAEPGGVCISGQVYDQIRNKTSVAMRKLEQTSLKNVKLPIDVYKIIMPWETEKSRDDSELDSRRVAVLPLKNMSPDTNDEYFADGMTEELITALSTVRELTVIARTSTMQYKNAPKRISEIARELSVGSIIEGSVRKAGSKARITVQLINAKDEGHLWAQNFDKQLDDVFSVQTDVAQRVADALKIKLVDEERRRIEKKASWDPDAHNTYLKGMFYFNKRTPEAMNRAVEFFEQSLKLDSNFALGYAALALTYNVMASNYYDDPDKCYPLAKKYALRALSMDEELAEVHATLGSIALGLDYDLDTAEQEFKRAIELNPSYPLGHLWYTHLLRYEMRFDESWKEINIALELSPLSLIINDNYADEFFFRKEYDKGVEYSRKILDMDPNFAIAYNTLVTNLLMQSKFDEALAELENYSKIAPKDAKLLYANAYASMGRTEDARKILSELEASYKESHTSPFFIASIHFLLQDNDKGFEWLEKAYSGHDRYIYVLASDPDLDDVRTDPRYLELLRRIGLAKHLPQEND